MMSFKSYQLELPPSFMCFLYHDALRFRELITYSQKLLLLDCKKQDGVTIFIKAISLFWILLYELLHWIGRLMSQECFNISEIWPWTQFEIMISATLVCEIYISFNNEVYILWWVQFIIHNRLKTTDVYGIQIYTSGLGSIKSQNFI